METMTYKTFGTCSQFIDISVQDGKICNVNFIGGCAGNTQGIAALVKGMEIKRAVACLKGIDCHGKGTSCPDQLAIALEKIQNNNQCQ